MKNLVLSLIIVFGFCGISFGQDYNSAIGLRLGLTTSVTYKSFLNETAAFEIFGSFRSQSFYNSFGVNGAYLIHNEIESVDRLKWYYGGGVGIAAYSYDTDYTGNTGNIGFTLNGYLGLEYTLQDAPISFSIDWVPTYIVGGVSGFGADNGALAVRYILN